jgi:16S rRNA (guanine527-N7)-methyltransferase
MIAGPSESIGELGYWCTGGSLEMGINLSSKQKELFERYYQIILRRNEQANLTAILSEKEVALKHFVDSLSCLLVAPVEGNSLVVDVGSGAGLPGIPLKIVRPEISLTLIESSAKKAEFLKEAVLLLGLPDVKVVLGRVEEISHRQDYRELFDYAVCRAVAPLPVVIEYCLGLVRAGGWMIALKGPAAVAEEKECNRALSLLGGALREVRQMTLPYLEHRRRLIVIEKIQKTPSEYPRRVGVPAKRPL